MVGRSHGLCRPLPVSVRTSRLRCAGPLAVSSDEWGLSGGAGHPSRWQRRGGAAACDRPVVRPCARQCGRADADADRAGAEIRAVLEAGRRIAVGGGDRGGELGTLRPQPPGRGDPAAAASGELDRQQIGFGDHTADADRLAGRPLGADAAAGGDGPGWGGAGNSGWGDCGGAPDRGACGGVGVHRGAPGAVAGTDTGHGAAARAGFGRSGDVRLAAGDAVAGDAAGNGGTGASGRPLRGRGWADLRDRSGVAEPGTAAELPAAASGLAV